MIISCMNNDSSDDTMLHLSIMINEQNFQFLHNVAWFMNPKTNNPNNQCNFALCIAISMWANYLWNNTQISQNRNK